MGRAERAAANESTFREVNERLEKKAAELSLGEERTPYLCECEDKYCTQVILLARQEYEAIRANPRTFVIMPGHQSSHERVTQEEAGFIVVEKTGEEGKLVQSGTRAPEALARYDDRTLQVRHLTAATIGEAGRTFDS